LRLPVEVSPQAPITIIFFVASQFISKPKGAPISRIICGYGDTGAIEHEAWAFLNPNPYSTLA
jgi:hypothetical protein